MRLSSFIRKSEECVSKDSFSPLDALALCWTTYFSYEGVRFPIAAKELAFRPFASELWKRNQTFVPKETADFMDAFLHSPRYQDVVFLEAKEVRDEEKATQFFAFVFAVEDLIVLAFEGTDTSSLGWKEDFMLTYCEGIPSYDHATAYAKDVLSRYEGDVILAGHSKGGNVATYVLSALEDDARIQRVYSFEGPGFYRRDIFKNHPERQSKIKKYVPQGSIVGVLLSDETKLHIVRSYDFGIFQHNAILWPIRDGHFLAMRRRTLLSHGTESAINGWLEALSNEEKKRFTILFFDAFTRIGVDDFRPFFQQFLIRFPALSKVYRTMEKEDRALFRKVARTLFSESLSALLPKPKKKSA